MMFRAMYKQAIQGQAWINRMRNLMSSGSDLTQKILEGNSKNQHALWHQMTIQFQHSEEESNSPLFLRFMEPNNGEFLQIPKEI